MFRPNQVGKLARRTGSDEYSRNAYAAPVDLPLAVVKLDIGLQKTTVRADSSASRGAAEETIAVEAVILVPASTQIAREDRVTVAGEDLRVVAVHKRYTVLGALDHLEIGLDRAVR